MEPPSTLAAPRPHVRFPIENRTGLRIPIAPLRKALAHVLGADARPVEVLLTDDEEMREINLQARGIDEPTDVLTFPAPQFPQAPLGEIVISVPYASRQAQERKIARDQEISYLAIHGALHLLGFDDIDEGDRERMFAEMHRIGLELGLPEQREWASLLHEGATP